MDEVCPYQNKKDAHKIFVFRQLARMSQKGEGYSLTQLAHQMYQWELKKRAKPPSRSCFSDAYQGREDVHQSVLEKIGHP